MLCCMSKRCCCCCGLVYGCDLIAFVDFTLNILWLVFCTIPLVRDVQRELPVSQDRDLFWVNVAFCAVSILCSLVLFCGLASRRRGFRKVLSAPWLLWTAARVIIYLVAGIYFLVVTATSGGEHQEMIMEYVYWGFVVLFALFYVHWTAAVYQHVFKNKLEDE